MAILPVSVTTVARISLASNKLILSPSSPSSSLRGCGLGEGSLPHAQLYSWRPSELTNRISECVAAMATKDVLGVGLSGF